MVCLVDAGRSIQAVQITIPDAMAFERIKERAEKQGRADDADEEMVQRRIGLFYEKTMPVIDHYKTEGQLTVVDGVGGIDEAEFRPMTEAELEGLVHEAFRNGSPLARRLAFGRLLEQLTADNAKTLVEHLKANKADKEQWRDFHYAWGTIDGESALKHAMESKEYDMAYTMSGWTNTRPEDIAAAVAFLLDRDQSGFMTGQEMIIDGGMTRKMIYV